MAKDTRGAAYGSNSCGKIEKEMKKYKNLSNTKQSSLKISMPGGGANGKGNK